MFRHVVRAPISLTRPSTIRSIRQITPLVSSIPTRCQSTAAVPSSHAISNPTLANITKRWEQMPPPEQAELWMQLRDRMVNDWNTLSIQEKRASYWIAFGNHGPRKLPPPDENRKVAFWTFVWVGFSLVLFILIRMAAKGPAQTMTKEWQEATNEYLKEQKSEPITGISSEGYAGKGYVQSETVNK